MHKGGQLRIVYVILGYTPSTKWFQSPKNVIRARDSRLALIDMAVLGFRTLSYPLPQLPNLSIPKSQLSLRTRKTKNPYPSLFKK